MDHQKDRGEPQAFKRWHWHKKTSFSRSVRGPRSGKPISCRELSVPGDEPPALPPGRKQGAMHPLRPGSAGGTRTNLLFTMSCRTGGGLLGCRKLVSKWMNGGAGRDRTDDPLLAKQVLSQLSYGPSLSSLRRRRRPPSPRLARHRARRPVGLADASHPTGANPPTWQLNMVGLGGLEPPTSRLSSARSNQLSYKPVQSTRRRPAPRGEASQGRPTVGAPAPPTLKPWPDRAAHAGASIIHEERETKAAGAALVKAMAK